MAPKKNFPLRLDPKLYEALEQWAGDEFRSVNGHIEYLLRESLQRAGRLPKAVLTGSTPETPPSEGSEGLESPKHSDSSD
ncbi:hypothetical protein GK047_20925 [Paenibacillus sp. SYP-B3998]|uniref:Toxin-antitoxin system HicB family antitoxin n=1 Tax=Paenibacillus sp. SYP-B3998 TaxID=2678564 RepID=A0A6G4A3F2_9BACL|nr:hypothetical protein [Paenibacillus sp. SYP-B3998]NEW08464.1 hypothetical protein [Paenibacillus sp. SYP-B3998]